jgi:hypothetical protein
MVSEGGIMAGVWGPLALAAAVVIQSPSAATFNRPSTAAAEATLALSALPESLRAGATVYVMGRKGYEKHQSGTNGVTCLVEQSRPDTQEPICWDPEGTETIMPLVFDKAAWRASGVAEDEIERRAAAGFESGKYRAPRRSGVAYMLSAENYVFNGQKVIRYSPHVMFYAPYLTNKDIGSDGKDPNAPWILGEGSPHAYIIVVTRHGK